jgi:hypothetical protein
VTQTLCVGQPVADELKTGTIRVRTDLIDMIRVICAHERDDDGSRLKAVEYVDSLLRESVVERHAAVMKRFAKQATDTDRKGKK